ncbi:Uncharacterized protein APZ42_031049 [Daphnia magna]|uniref:ZSWIM1/3 RNaseH-like domain-containing protein n=1 Tax=Daphnia magna TaxID=35525 RepID=A0A164N6S1_9CRUS|nr:Uncharacterized protein APZ42_031049 [Daphnia magna]
MALKMVINDEVEVEDNVYLRRDKPLQSVASYNSNSKIKKKMDEKWLFKKISYVCPYFGNHRDRSKTNQRANQNVMAQNCPVHVQFQFCSRQEKFFIVSINVVHQNHHVSAQHVTTCARKKHLGPEALAFAEATLSAGAQPTKVRKLLQDKYGANLISKDLVNIKQTLTGKSDNEWIDTVDYMMDLQKDHNNVIKVLHNSDGEVAAIFVQLEKQRQLYKTYGNVIELDGTYKTTRAGFSLYHLLIEDNNGDGQPVAMFFVKEETTDSISTCLEVFSENNDISVTKVTVTDNVRRLPLLQSYRREAKQNKEYRKKKNEIQEYFRSALFAATQKEFDASHEHLMRQDGCVAAYFRDNWFNIIDKWAFLARRNLQTFGNNTTNRLERFHHTIKDVLQKTKRLPEVLRTLVNIILLRLSDRQVKQNMWELRFSTKSKHLLLQNYAKSISPYAWTKVEGEMKIMKKTYDFFLDEELSFGLPCRHIIFFHIKDHIEIPAG